MIDVILTRIRAGSLDKRLVYTYGFSFENFDTAGAKLCRLYTNEINRIQKTGKILRSQLNTDDGQFVIESDSWTSVCVLANRPAFNTGCSLLGVNQCREKDEYGMPK